jgi:uncharacterized protein (TIGR02265 family)
MSMSREATLEGGAPPDWAWELEQRMVLATPQDTTRGLFLLSVLEAVQSLGDTAALERCREVLGGQQFVAFFNYPVTLLMRLTLVAVRELSVRYGSPEAALRMLGRKAAEDFVTSAVGNAVRVVAGKDIKQFLGSAQTIYRMAASYGQRTVEWLGPKAGRLSIRHTFLPPPYHEGVLREMLERLGGKSVKVEGRQTSPLDSLYDFSWE